MFSFPPFERKQSFAVTFTRLCDPTQPNRWNLYLFQWVYRTCCILKEDSWAGGMVTWCYTVQLYSTIIWHKFHKEITFISCRNIQSDTNSYTLHSQAMVMQLCINKNKYSQCHMMWEFNLISFAIMLPSSSIDWNCKRDPGEILLRADLEGPPLYFSVSL